MGRRSEQTRRKDGLERQAQIMQVALDLFAEKGYHSTRVDDIIKKSNIAKSTFYFHFKSKKEILSSLIDHYISIFYESLKKFDISVKKPSIEIRDIFLDISHSLISVPEYRKFVKLMLGEIVCMQDPFFEKLEVFFQAVTSLGIAVISRAQKDGRVSPDIDPAVTCYCTLGGIKEVAHRWLVTGEIEDIDKALSSSIELYFNGLFLDPITGMTVNTGRGKK